MIEAVAKLIEYIGNDLLSGVREAQTFIRFYAFIHISIFVNEKRIMSLS